MGLSHERLKSLLEYDPNTGSFKWRVSPRANVKAGAKAGWVMGGYLFIMIDQKTYGANRLAWFYVTEILPPSDLQVDHRNRVRLDNSWGNLRLLTQEDNKKNKGHQTNNTSGVTGVCWYKREGKWKARIDSGKKRKCLGTFSSFEDAVAARKAAEGIYHTVTEVQSGS